MGSEPYIATFPRVKIGDASFVKFHQYVRSRLSVADGIEDIDECRITLPVDRLEFDGNESGIAESVAFEKIW